jgi:enoyl-CoA hydratase
LAFENILLTINDGIALVTINRPDKLNALNAKTFAELDKAIDEIKMNNDIFILVITGAGKKAFVAGADINELSQSNEETGKEFAQRGQQVFNKIENLGKPVIAAVNGFALGGGCELSLACHIRFASENAMFGQPEVNLGIIPGYGGTQRLPKIVNPARAIEYILTGEMIDASEAFRIGLVNKVFSQDELIDKVFELSKKIISKGPIAVKMSLQSILNSRNMPLSEGLNSEADLFGKCCGTLDFKEGTEAFLEKRKPDFKNI